jgi:geranylgeranyl diphosphate synthase type I
VTDPANDLATLLEDLATIAARVDADIAGLVDDQAQRWAAAGGDATVQEVLARYRAMALSGGKRLRPAFVWWAYEGAGGDPDDEQVLHAALAVELLHTFALIHDDVMDQATTRRSVETIHVSYARRHGDLGLRGDADHYGQSIAILMGDLAFAHAAQLITKVPRACGEIFFGMCADLMVGQYLDIEAGAQGVSAGSDVADQITELKTARYTVESPLLIGAALAGRSAELDDHLRRYGNPLGHAFQLRDDVLGAFGDPTTTGKPVGNDLAQGKVTRLLELALARADPADRDVLLRLGATDTTDAEIARAAEIVVASGALAEVEATIDRLVDEAVRAIEAAPLTPRIRGTLAAAAHLIGHRDR